jgi:hypothetical protein
MEQIKELVNGCLLLAGFCLLYAGLEAWGAWRKK